MHKTGQTIERGNKVPDGLYHTVVHIWPINRNGEILIQKRADSVQWNPGIWAITSGSIVAGEDFYTGCKRELHEELGLSVDEDSLTLAAIFNRQNNYCSVWTLKTDVCISELCLQTPGGFLFQN